MPAELCGDLCSSLWKSRVSTSSQRSSLVVACNSTPKPSQLHTQPFPLPPWCPWLWTLTRNIGSLFLPSTLFTKHTTFLHTLPLAFTSLRQVSLYTNRFIEYEAQAVIGVFRVEPGLSKAEVARHRLEAGLGVASDYARCAIYEDFSKTLSVLTKVLISMGPRDGCVHGILPAGANKSEHSRGCVGACHNEYCEVSFKEGKTSISVKQGRGWWELSNRDSN